MITDAQVFDWGFLPNRLPHRDAEIGTLANAFDAARDGDAADDVLIHGPHGVGKTAATRFTLQRLEAQSGVRDAYVQCMGKSSAGILRATLRELGADPAQNTPLEDLSLQLRDRVVDPVIVVLDEADDLPETNALARLWDVDGLSVVVICHDRERWLARADDQAQRHLTRGGTELELQRYGVDELADILEHRGDLGLVRRAVDREQLEWIADEAAGVARFGITALHAAADIAEGRRHRSVQPADIEDGFERAHQWIREANLASLAFHHHVLYELIRSAGEIEPAALHERYETVADDVYRGTSQTAIGERTRRYKLEKLREYDLIEFDGDNQYSDVYRPTDPSIASSLDSGLNLQRSD